MPNRAKKYCKKQGCSNYAELNSAYCFMHKSMHKREVKNYEKWYNLIAWKRIRHIKLRECPLCEECTKQGRMTKATDVDHIIPHKGDWHLFTSKDNLQCLCHSCHSEKTNREMNRNA